MKDVSSDILEKTTHQKLLKNHDKTTTTTTSQEYLEKYGYITKKDNEGPASLISLVEALKALQRFASISVTGKLDAATKRLMKRKRCQLKDIIHPDSPFGKRFIARCESYFGLRI